MNSLAERGTRVVMKRLALIVGVPVFEVSRWHLEHDALGINERDSNYLQS